MEMVEYDVTDDHGVLRYRVKFYFNMSLDGGIEILQIGEDDQHIEIPGEAVALFLSAYLKDRKIDQITFLPLGYRG